MSKSKSKQEQVEFNYRMSHRLYAGNSGADGGNDFSFQLGTKKAEEEDDGGSVDTDNDYLSDVPIDQENLEKTDDKQTEDAKPSKKSTNPKKSTKDRKKSEKDEEEFPVEKKKSNLQLVKEKVTGAAKSKAKDKEGTSGKDDAVPDQNTKSRKKRKERKKDRSSKDRLNGSNAPSKVESTVDIEPGKVNERAKGSTALKSKDQKPLPSPKMKTPAMPLPSPKMKTPAMPLPSPKMKTPGPKGPIDRVDSTEQVNLKVVKARIAGSNRPKKTAEAENEENTEIMDEEVEEPEQRKIPTGTGFFTKVASTMRGTRRKKKADKPQVNEDVLFDAKKDDAFEFFNPNVESPENLQLETANFHEMMNYAAISAGDVKKSRLKDVIEKKKVTGVSDKELQSESGLATDEKTDKENQVLKAKAEKEADDEINEILDL